MRFWYWFVLVAFVLAGCSATTSYNQTVFRQQNNSANPWQTGADKQYAVGAIEWNGQELLWDWHKMPHRWAHFDIYYSDGQAPSYSTFTLNTPGYAIPDPPKTCTMERWIVYYGIGKPYKEYPIKNPAQSDILGQGLVRVCGNANTNTGV